MRFDIRSQDPADLAAAFATLQIAAQEGVRITITMERNPRHRRTTGTLNGLAAEANMSPLPRGKLSSQVRPRVLSCRIIKDGKGLQHYRPGSLQA